MYALREIDSHLVYPPIPLRVRYRLGFYCNIEPNSMFGAIWVKPYMLLATNPN